MKTGENASSIEELSFEDQEVLKEVFNPISGAVERELNEAETSEGKTIIGDIITGIMGEHGKTVMTAINLGMTLAVLASVYQGMHVVDQLVTGPGYYSLHASNPSDWQDVFNKGVLRSVADGIGAVGGLVVGGIPVMCLRDKVVGKIQELSGYRDVEAEGK